MPRAARQKSALGIYHVMLRGINKQDIFFKEDDFLRMMKILQEIPFQKDNGSGKIVSSNQCTIYAYCILHNHLHILIREGERPLSETMKIIEDRYAVYYNKKYVRVGHLFQGRFASEAINDETYFRVVFRYIAQNSVKAMESKTPESYPYSSWNEYLHDKSNVMKVIKPTAIQSVFSKYPLPELTEWVNTTNEDRCLDMDTFSNVLSDEEAWEQLSDISGYTNPEDFRLLDPQTQIYYLLEAIKYGITLRQASRLGNITYYQLQKIQSKRQESMRKVGANPIKRSDPAVGEKLEQNGRLQELQDLVRRIHGLGKQTYHKLHRIIEYLYPLESAKCSDIANFLEISNEGTRKLLILLVNEQIINIEGQSRSRVYKIKRTSKSRLC